MGENQICKPSAEILLELLTNNVNESVASASIAVISGKSVEPEETPSTGVDDLRRARTTYRVLGVPKYGQ